MASGLVSLAGLGGNTTGLSFNEVGTNAKRLDLLKEAVPAVTRVVVLTNPGSMHGLMPATPEVPHRLGRHGMSTRTLTRSTR